MACFPCLQPKCEEMKLIDNETNGIGLNDKQFYCLFKDDNKYSFQIWTKEFAFSHIIACVSIANCKYMHMEFAQAIFLGKPLTVQRW